MNIKLTDPVNVSEWLRVSSAQAVDVLITRLVAYWKVISFLAWVLHKFNIFGVVYNKYIIIFRHYPQSCASNAYCSHLVTLEYFRLIYNLSRICVQKLWEPLVLWSLHWIKLNLGLFWNFFFFLLLLSVSFSLPKTFFLFFLFRLTFDNFLFFRINQTKQGSMCKEMCTHIYVLNLKDLIIKSNRNYKIIKSSIKSLHFHYLIKVTQVIKNENNHIFVLWKVVSWHFLFLISNLLN